jgi:hypothetical protein
VIVFAIELIGTVFLHYILFPLQKQYPEIPLLLCHLAGILHKACLTVWALRRHDLLQPFSKLFHLRAAAVGRFFPYRDKVEVLIPTRRFQSARAILKYLYGCWRE